MNQDTCKICVVRDFVHWTYPCVGTVYTSRRPGAMMSICCYEIFLYQCDVRYSCGLATTFVIFATALVILHLDQWFLNLQPNFGSTRLTIGSRSDILWVANLPKNISKNDVFQLSAQMCKCASNFKIQYMNYRYSLSHRTWVAKI